MVYPILLIAGFVGLLVMGMMGFMHHGHHDGHHGAADGHDLHHGPVHDAPGHHGHIHAPHGHHGPVHHAPTHHGHAAPGHHGHGHHGHGQHGHGHHDNPNADGNAEATVGQGGFQYILWLMPLLSPLNWFSWLLGGGAAGTIAQLFRLHEPWLALIALAGALLFNVGVVKPVWNTVFAFASRPAGNLDSCLMQHVEAVTGFDRRGEGLVRVLIDGRSEDILARLTDEERSAGTRIRRGDSLLIEEVDPRTNSCRVSRG